MRMRYMGRVVRFACCTVECLMAAACGPRNTTFLHENTASHWAYEPAAMTIVGPFDQLLYRRHQPLFDPDHKKFEAKYHKASLQYQGQSLRAKIRIRGGMRFCDSFPHFTLKMRGGDALLGRHKYKIVSPGAYQLDPLRAIEAPACGDALASRTPGSTYEGEYRVYRLAAGILDFHFKTLPLTITYRDEVSGAETTGFSFLIENIEDAAKRYHGSEHTFGPLHDHVSWKTADDERLGEALIGDEIFNFLVRRYRAIASAHPELTDEEISARLPSLASISSSPAFDAMKAAALARLPTLRSNLPKMQHHFLRTMDHRAMLQAILFNILVGNTDWALFGLNDHATGTRNFKYLTVGGLVYPIAYDFDFSAIGKGRAVSREDYRASLRNLEERVISIFGSLAQLAYALHKDAFAKRIRDFLGANPDVPEAMRSSFFDFLEAI